MGNNGELRFLLPGKIYVGIVFYSVEDKDILVCQIYYLLESTPIVIRVNLTTYEVDIEKCFPYSLQLIHAALLFES